MSKNASYSSIADPKANANYNSTDFNLQSAWDKTTEKHSKPSPTTFLTSQSTTSATAANNNHVSKLYTDREYFFHILIPTHDQNSFFRHLVIILILTHS